MQITFATQSAGQAGTLALAGAAARLAAARRAGAAAVAAVAGLSARWRPCGAALYRIGLLRAQRVGGAGRRGRQRDRRRLRQDAGGDGDRATPAARAACAVGVVSRGYGRSTQRLPRGAARQRPARGRRRAAADPPRDRRAGLRGAAAASRRRARCSRAHPAHAGHRQRRRPAAPGAGARRRDLRLRRPRHRQRLAAAGRPAARALAARCDLVLRTGERPAFAGFDVKRRLALQAHRADGARTPLAALRAGPWWPSPASPSPRPSSTCCARRACSCEQCIALPDHHDFRAQPVEPAGMELLCTEKDAVKLWRSSRRPGPCRSSWKSPAILVFAGSPGSTQSYHRSMDTKLLELLVCPVTKGHLDTTANAGTAVAQRPPGLPGARRHPGAAGGRGAHPERRRAGAPAHAHPVGLEPPKHGLLRPDPGAAGVDPPARQAAGRHRRPADGGARGAAGQRLIRRPRRGGRRR